MYSTCMCMYANAQLYMYTIYDDLHVVHVHVTAYEHACSTRVPICTCTCISLSLISPFLSLPPSLTLIG